MRIVPGTDSRPFPAPDVAEADDSPKSVIWLVFELNRQSLEDTEHLLDTARLTQTARILRRADRIFVVGAGRSAVVAHAASQKLLSLGLTATKVTEPAGVGFRSLGKRDAYWPSHTRAERRPDSGRHPRLALRACLSHDRPFRASLE